MATAKDARAWARAGLRGIGNSLYTPFSGTDGDEIDWDAYRTLVRYCVGELGHEMLWCTSGIAEFWALTLDERKRLLEVAVEEGRRANPDVVVQACTASMSAKDCVELTRHAQQVGADIAYIQTPMMETHAGDGVLRFFRYVADRTDIALGMFNSPSSGYVLTRLFLCALGGVRGKNRLKDIYTALTARGKAKKLALVACARKALVWAWAVFTQDTTFDPALAAKL